MTTTQTTTTRMRQHQIADSGAALGRAFFDDPLMEYILPDEGKRGPASTWFFTAAAKLGHHYGEVYTTGEKVDGNAIWLPPGKVKVSIPKMIRSGMLMAPIKFGLGPFSRFLTVMNTLEHLHDRDMPEPHWYLMVLGVDPPRQGQGVGGALIQPIIERADADGLPCYLETMKTRNVTFYEKHGFSVIVEDDLPKGGPHFWTMKRPARR